MDPIRNPYAPGAGSRPPALTGREREIESFEVLLGRLRQGNSAKSQMITGLRGVGKTVLLTTFRDIAQATGFQTADTEITHEMDFRSVMARLSRRALLALDPLEKAKDMAWQAARVFRAFTLKLPDGYELGVDVDAIRGRGDSGNLSEDLSDLFVALGEAAREKSGGIVFLLDEIQFLATSDLEALIAAAHQVSQRNLPVAVVGAGLPHLPKLAGEARSYAERLFDFPQIDRLAMAAARAALEKPAEKLGVRFEEAATTAILEFTEGYPYFLQEFGKHVWNVATEKTITLADAEASRAQVVAHLDENFFRVRIARAAPSERRYLSAMASIGGGPYRTGDIADRLGKSVTSVAPIRGQLINKGIVYSPEHGINAFTVPQFDDFLRRSYPFRPEAP